MDGTVWRYHEYDENGRLNAIVDANGNRTEYAHDIEGRTEMEFEQIVNDLRMLYYNSK